MKFKTVKTMAMAFSLLAWGIAPMTTEAASISGTLGMSVAAIDTYTFTCPKGTAQSRVRIMDMNTIFNSAATVYATFGEDANPTLTALDTESTSTGSPFSTNTSDGPGIYALTVHKSAADLEDYIVEAQCIDSLGVDTPIKLFFRLNQ